MKLLENPKVHDHRTKKPKRLNDDDHMLRFARSSPDAHLLRFAKKSEDDDHFLRFAKFSDDDHMLRFARRNPGYMLGYSHEPDQFMLRFSRDLEAYRPVFSKRSKRSTNYLKPRIIR